MGMGSGRLSGVGVFDFDGTLVDTLGEISSALNLSLIHISEPRDRTRSRMPSSA